MDFSKKPNYQAWEIDSVAFPFGGSIADQANFIAQYGILAPSTHNTQPWLFHVADNQIHISLNPSLTLPIGDPQGWGAAISIGAFVENAVQAANAFGLDCQVDNSGEGAVITLSGNAQNPDEQALRRITSRLSDKLPYNAKQLDEQTGKLLERLSNEKVGIRIVRDRQLKNEIIKNHTSAATAIARNPKFGKELARWLRTNNTSSYDGMPGFVVGNSQLKSLVGSRVLQKKPQILEKLVVKDRHLFESGDILVLTAKIDKNDFAEQVEWGRIVERVWLKITELGLSAHPQFASIQDPRARKILAELLDTDNTPVFLMRIGYSKNKQLHTPRRKAMEQKSALDILASTMTSHPKTHSIKIARYEINYITAGKGSPVLLIHGANIGWAQWHLNIDALANKHTVYALDLPGAGKSTNVNFRQMKFESDYLDIVDEFIEKLNLKKVDIVGSSFGGWIAMRLAAARKPYIRKLVVSNPIGFTTYMPPKFRPVSIWPLALLMSKTALRPNRDNKNLEKFMRDVFYKKDIPLKPEFIDYFYELSRTSHNVLFISRLAHFKGMRPELVLRNELEKITVPTMVIWGKQDPLMPYKTVKNNFKLVKNLRLEVLSQVGHMPPVENPTDFNALVLDFLKEKAR